MGSHRKHLRQPRINGGSEMTVQELIDELMKVEDKSAVINVIEGDADNDFVYEIRIEWNGNYPIIVI